MILGIVLNPNYNLRLFLLQIRKFEFENLKASPAMKPNVSKGSLTISPRVTRSTTTPDRNSSTLPVEIVTEILSRLPSKSIARFRCVCKLWSSELRSRYFTELVLAKTCDPRLLLDMDSSVKAAVSGFVQRSVCTACQTTKELVLKDYALEPDETRIYSAAHLLVSNIAGSLAHATCKEPLRTSISGYLWNSLQGLNIKSEALELIVQLVTNDTLDLGCAAIEQAAREKAVQAIDADIAKQLLLRRKPSVPPPLTGVES